MSFPWRVHYLFASSADASHSDPCACWGPWRDLRVLGRLQSKILAKAVCNVMLGFTGAMIRSMWRMKICWQFSVRIVEPSTPCDSYTSSVMSFIEVEEPSVSVNLTRSEKATRVAPASFIGEKFHWTAGSHSIQCKGTLNCRDDFSLTQAPNFCWTHPQLVLSLHDQSRHSER